jgi:hypothetical protein
MQTAQTPLTTGKLADMVSASSKNNKKLHQYTVTNPSTVFIYSSGYHTHHSALLDTLLGAKFFQHWREFLRCPAHNTYLYIRDKKINIYIYGNKWTLKPKKEKRFEYSQNQVGIEGWNSRIISNHGQNTAPTSVSDSTKWWVWSSNKWVLSTEKKGLSYAKGLQNLCEVWRIQAPPTIQPTLISCTNASTRHEGRSVTDHQLKELQGLSTQA